MSYSKSGIDYVRGHQRRGGGEEEDCASDRARERAREREREREV